MEVEEEEVVCILRLAVSTNWPTAAEKPARKALNGYTRISAHRLPKRVIREWYRGRTTDIISSDDTIHKLYPSYKHQIHHKRIEKERPLRRLRKVAV